MPAGGKPYVNLISRGLDAGLDVSTKPGALPRAAVDRITGKTRPGALPRDVVDRITGNPRPANATPVNRELIRNLQDAGVSVHRMPQVPSPVAAPLPERPAPPPIVMPKPRIGEPRRLFNSNKPAANEPIRLPLGGGALMAAGIGAISGGIYGAKDGDFGGAVRGAVGGAVVGSAFGFGAPALARGLTANKEFMSFAGSYSSAAVQLSNSLATAEGRSAMFAAGGMLGGLAAGGSKSRSKKRGFNKNRGNSIGY